MFQIDAIVYRHHMIQQTQQQQQQPAAYQAQMRQRYMKTRQHTNSLNGRSLSNSRKSDDFSREMDIMTRSENYKYDLAGTHSPNESLILCLVIICTVTLDLPRTLAQVIRVPKQCQLH